SGGSGAPVCHDRHPGLRPPARPPHPVRASVAFDQRLPELWSGEGRPVPYPASCRPQAWSAAAAVVVAEALRVLREPQHLPGPARAPRLGA
ncbi:MAG: hypothetical protein ACJ72G_05880, partial [Friedmanniella sp.]